MMPKWAIKAPAARPGSAVVWAVVKQNFCSLKAMTNDCTVSQVLFRTTFSRILSGSEMRPDRPLITRLFFLILLENWGIFQLRETSLDSQLP